MPSCRSSAPRSRSPPATSPTATSSKTLLAAIPAEHPLGAVIHAAGVLDDGLIDSLDPEQPGPRHRPQGRRRLAPARADRGARALRTSSSSPRSPACSAVAGQGNYAAANAFLDALAAQRRAEGLPATSLAWGVWERASGMTAELERGRPGADARARASRPLSDEQGLELFDAAPSRGSPARALAVRARSRRRCARAAEAGTLPPLLSAAWSACRLAAARRAAARSPQRLAALPEAEREEAVVARAGPRPTSPPCSATPPADGDRSRAAPSRTSASTRWPRSSCATGSTPRPGCGCRRTLGLRLPQRPQAAAPRYLLGSEAAQRAREAEGAASPRPEASEEPIAIVGMACRYPGGVDSPSELWQLVAEGRRRDLELPRRPRLGPERLYRPRPRPARHQLRPRGRLPRRRRRLRRRASSASPRARRWRWTPSSGCCWKPPGRRWRTPASTRGAARQTQTGVFAGVMYQDYGRRRPRGEGYVDRRQQQRRLRPRRLRPRPRGPGDHRRHRLLLLAGGDAPGRPGAARRRVLAGPGRRRHRPRHPRRLHRVQPPARPRPRRALQVLRRGGRRGRLVGGRRRAGPASASPTPARTATRSSPRSAAPPSTRTAPPTASPPPTAPPRSG